MENDKRIGDGETPADQADLNLKDSASVTLSVSSSSSSPRRVGMPWSVLLMIYGTIAGDAFALNIVTPFISQLVQYQYHVSESLNSLAAGALNGAFSLATFLSSFFLGHLSDHIGRRPLMLFGLFTSGVCTIIFSVVDSFGLAFLVRSFAGFTNSNIALCKAFISDLPMNAQDRSVAYAYQGAAFQLSRLVASAVAGLTVGVMLFGYENPFFFPSLIGGGMNLIFFSLGLFMLPESLKRHQPSSSPTEASSRSSHWAQLKKVFSDLFVGLAIIREDRLMIRLIVISSINSFSNGSVLILLTLFFHLSISLGGLSYDSLYSGLCYAYFGLVAFVFQIVFYKKFQKAYGIYQTYLYGSAILGSGCALLPLSALFYQLLDTSLVAHIMTGFVLVVALSLMSIGFMLCLPLVNAMISNAGDARRQGLIQGTAMSLNSLCRGLGPVISGGLLSLCILIPFPPLVFWFVSMCNVACWMIAKRFGELEKRRCNGEEKRKGEEEEEEEEEQEENGNGNGGDESRAKEQEVTHTIDEFHEDDESEDVNELLFSANDSETPESVNVELVPVVPLAADIAYVDGSRLKESFTPDGSASSATADDVLDVPEKSAGVGRLFAPSGYEKLQTSQNEGD